MNDFFDDITWEDWAFAGAMAEEMSEEEKMRQRLEKEEGPKDDCPCCCEDCEDSDPPEYDPFNPPDEDPYP